MAHHAAQPDIDELELALQGTLASSVKGKLIEVCEKLNMTDPELVNKSRLSLVKLIILHVENEIEKRDHEGQRTFLAAVQQHFVEKGPTIDDARGDADSLDGSTPDDNQNEAALTENEAGGEGTIFQGHAANLSENSGSVKTGSVQEPKAQPKMGGNSEFEMLKTILKRDLRISGTIGGQGQKDQLSYISLTRQIHSAMGKGYKEREIVDAIIRAIAPGVQLRDYLEAMRDSGLASVMKIIRAHYHEKSAAELYTSLANLVQSPSEEPREFLLRALNLREKIIFASHEEHSKLKYDDAQCQSLFLHALETGLISNNLRSRMRPLLKTTDVKDEDLIAELNIAVTEEAERNSKLGLGAKQKAKIAQVEKKSPKPDDPPTKVDPTEQLIKEMRALKADVATLRQEMTKQKDRESASGGGAHGGGPRQDRPRGCEKCVRDGKNCTHCWKCGASDHYAYRCTQNKGQGNYPRLLTRDAQ